MTEMILLLVVLTIGLLAILTTILCGINITKTINLKELSLETKIDSLKADLSYCKLELDNLKKQVEDLKKQLEDLNAKRDKIRPTFKKGV